MFVPKAHLNYRYHARRAVYLMAIARHLRDVSYSLFGEQRLEALHGDPTRPVLVLQPPKAGGYSLRILPSIAPATFALPRLAPDRNGVRTHCKAAAGKGAASSSSLPAAEAAGNADQEQQQQLLPTPHYNAGILEDMLLPVHAARLKSVLASSPRLLDGLLLLKVWARQHGLHARSAAAPATANSADASTSSYGGGCLDGCLLSMLVLLLSERNKMAGSMSVLQVFRAALQLLADSGAWSKGLALGRVEGGAAGSLPAGVTPPTMQCFKAHHQVVFLDFTGYLNVAAHMTRGSLAHVQLLARRTLDLLIAPADPDEAFAAALLTPLSSPAAAFDYHWRVSLPSPSSSGSGAAWPVVKKKDNGAEAATGSAKGAEDGEELVRQAMCRDRPLWREQEVQIEQLVRQALTDRAKVVRVIRRPLSSSCVPEDLEHGLIPLAGCTSASPSSFSTAVSSSSCGVWVGAVVDPLAACRLVDVGPAADDAPAAARFRRFWGDKSELRRWQDGKITETAVWEVAPHLRHTIPDLILQHTVIRHLPSGSSLAGAASGCLDWALTCRTSPPGADLTASRAAEAAAEKLGKQLRALEGLALKVIGVQPLSSVTRGTAPLPPQPHPLAGGSAAGAGAGEAGGSGGIPRCLDPMEVLVTLESSGRWPDDPVAFRKMKAALGLQLAASLASSYGHHVSASEEAVDVLLDGFAFRLVLYSGRDEAMLTKAAAAASAAAGDATAVTPGGAGAGGVVGSGQLSPEESPLLLSWHHGLIALVGGANAAYAPAARLAGRWVAAHMMSNHVTPQAVELLVAAAFGGAGVPAGAPPPGSRVTGFLRFLQLLARWPWSLRPLVVDPAGELREAERRDIRKRFEARRAAGEAPALYICTPRDRESRHWTQRGPSTAVLQRLAVLAARSSALLQLLLQPTAVASVAPSHATPSGLPAEWQGVFSTPASDFDAFILLRKEALPHADLAMSAPPASTQRHGSSKPSKASTLREAAGPEAALSSLLLPSGGAVRDLLQPAVPGGPPVALDGPASGPDALSDVLEDAGPSEPPPKRARAFLRCFPDKVVAAKGAARLQPELLVGFDPVSRLLSELAAGYGHLATFCVDALGGRLVGVRWAPDAFLPQPLRLNTAHTALPLVLTAAGEEEGAKGGAAAGGLCVPNVFAVLREVKELGLGLVEDVVLPPSSAKARAAW
ncbi:hypothetical protein Agub_g14187 [Astrephomene gubernaculifera]|uniref:Nucleolar protein 6 n=1 Tax=Astrephomene gubernaculifera TaxID=47775 RepID=A0AAD3HSX3_9CHLO|nr:hypothetical protein Agub_g14187 [Astrephomene gubernaculifera]